MIISKRWGHEEIQINNELYCKKKLYVTVGKCTSLHVHKRKDETFLIKEGTFEIAIQHNEHLIKKYILQEKDILRIFPETPHRITCLDSANSEGLLEEISTHSSPEDSHRIKL